MTKTVTKTDAATAVEVKKEAKNKEITFLKNLYTDFKETFGAVFGDAEEFAKQHKVLLIIAFIGFLLYRNKVFSINGFVKRLEERIKEDRDW